MAEMLKDYRQLGLEVTLLERHIDEIENQLNGVKSRCFTGLSGEGGVRRDFTDRVAKLVDIKTIYEEKWDRLIDLRAEIERRIDALSPTERVLVRARYIEGLEWFKVAGLMNLSEAQVYRIHSKALGGWRSEVR